MKHLNIPYFSSLVKTSNSLFAQICLIGCECFLGAFIILGMVFAVLIPPFQAPDENAHWLAGYARTNTSLLETQSAEHCSLANMLPEIFDTKRIAFQANQKIDGKNYKSIGKLTSACSSFSLSYGHIGTYPGIVLARLLTTNEETIPEKTLQVFILSRVLQGFMIGLCMLRFIFLVYRSKTYLPGILLTCAGLLSPLFLQQSFAISADGITFALSIILLTFYFYLKECRWYDWALLFFFSIAVGATKPPLFGLIPCLLLGGYIRAYGWNNCLEGKIKKIALGLFSCVMLSFIGSLWMATKEHKVLPEQILGRDLSVLRQLQFTLEHPFHVLNVLLRSVGGAMNFTRLTGPLGWLDAPLSAWTITKVWQICLVALILECLYIGSRLYHMRSTDWTMNNMYSKCAAALCGLGALFITALLVSFTLYITWSPVGAASVDGVQPRYFFPVLIVLPLLLGSFLPQESNASETSMQHNKVYVVTSYGVFTALILSFFVPVILDLLLRWW